MNFIEQKLIAHVGHKVEVATYGMPVVNITLECMTCGVVVIDGDDFDTED